MNILTRKITIVTAVVSTLLFSLFAQADEASDIAAIRAELVEMIPVVEEAEITSTDVDGVYRLLIQGNYAYAYVDGDFALIGDLFNTKDKVNLGEVAASERMSEVINDVPTSKMIVYGPEKPKRYISVFTDIDCGYCQKLHREIPQLTAAGIQVRYLAYPRAGVPSGSYDKYQNVWCSDDQQASLTAAKAGQSLPAKVCDNPIQETFNLGREVGVRGTPTMVFDDGTVVPGYVQYDQLIERLGLSEG